MKILFLGDIMGRAGRDAVIEYVPKLRAEMKLDAVIVNCENAAHGFGVNVDICKALYDAGVDCLTTGNHVWDQREILSYIEKDKKLLRPINYPPGTPGNGSYVIETLKGEKILVMNAMGQLYMQALDDPFAAVENCLKQYRMGHHVDAVIIDMHAEANSEKMAMAHHFDGRVSLVVGTHTHIPTADAQIFEGGTGYQTDAGMCGDYNSVIGMQKEAAIMKFTKKVPYQRLQPGVEEATICGVYIETERKTGKCKKIEPVRLGGRLKQTTDISS